MRRQFLKGLGIQCIAIAILFVTTNMTIAQNSDQSQYVEQVRSQLNRARDLLEARGFEKTHDYKIATLANGSAKSTTLELDEGMQYAIVGVCDKDCTDLDIKLYDENDKQVAADTTADDKPVVSITPRWTGQFRVLVSMYKCGNSPCYYGVGVFGK